jgi:uncharacterized protein
MDEAMEPGPLDAALEAAEDGGTRLRVKVVPGASRSRLAGLLGDRLKIQIAAPPEGGKANRAVCALVAEHLGVAASRVCVVQGTSRPQKTLHIEGLPPADVARLLADAPT